MQLLDLPDELLSPIILEAMWATTTTRATTPDLLMWERRLTNHPATQRKKVAFVGQICQRLRRIAEPHLKPPQLWADSSHRLEFGRYHSPLPRETPASLAGPSIRAVALSAGQAVSLPSVSASVTEHLTDLSLTSEHNALTSYQDSAFATLSRYKSLIKLELEMLSLSMNAHPKIFDDVASSSSLQAVRLFAIDSVFSIREPLAREWRAPLVRLEISWVGGAHLAMFCNVMQHAASTLEMAIFRHPDRAIFSSPTTSPEAAIRCFPRLWRLEIDFGEDFGNGWKDGVYIRKTETQAGRLQVADCSPIAVWRAAPRLEYLQCSEQIEVTTQKDLDEVDELRKRKELRRVRLKLETWKGAKGAAWTNKKVQSIEIG